MIHHDHVSTSLEVSSLIVPGTELGEDTSNVSESFRFCCFRGAESIGGVDQGRHMVSSDRGQWLPSSSAAILPAKLFNAPDHAHLLVIGFFIIQ